MPDDPTRSADTQLHDARKRPGNSAVLAHLALWAILLATALSNLAVWYDQYTELPVELSVAVPYVAAVSVAFLIFIILVKTRNKTWGGAALVVASVNAIAALSLFLPVWIRAQPPSVVARERGQVVRVMTANLWTNYGAIPDFLELVETEQPDFLFIQEGYDPWRTVLERELTGYARIAGCAYRHTCNSVIYSRWTGHRLIEGDGKGYAAAEVWREGKPGARRLILAGVHLSRSNPERTREELEDLSRGIGGLEGALLIAGDFNMSPWDRRIRGIEKAYGVRLQSGLGRSWPTNSRLDIQREWIPLPGVSIDHVFADRHYTRVGEPRRFDFGSDHFAIVVDVATSLDP